MRLYDDIHLALFVSMQMKCNSARNNNEKHFMVVYVDNRHANVRLLELEKFLYFSQN